MSKKPIDHFSLSDWRKSITEHASPFFTLTKGEVEALVGRLEKARIVIAESAEYDAASWVRANDWLASLEREGNK